MEESENAFSHNRKSFVVWKMIKAKRCFRVRGIHDLETRQQILSVSLASRRRSTMSSSSSVGRRGSGILCGGGQENQPSVFGTDADEVCQLVMISSSGKLMRDGNNVKKQILIARCLQRSWSIGLIHMNGKVFPKHIRSHHCHR